MKERENEERQRRRRPNNNNNNNNNNKRNAKRFTNQNGSFPSKMAVQQQIILSMGLNGFLPIGLYLVLPSESPLVLRWTRSVVIDS